MLEAMMQYHLDQLPAEFETTFEALRENTR